MTTLCFFVFREATQFSIMCAVYRGSMATSYQIMSWDSATVLFTSGMASTVDLWIEARCLKMYMWKKGPHGCLGFEAVQHWQGNLSLNRNSQCLDPVNRCTVL